MAQRRKRYQLLVYEHLIKRWTEIMFALGVVMIGVGWLITWTDLSTNYVFIPGLDFLLPPSNFLYIIGALVLFFTLFLFSIRKSAYVRCQPAYVIGFTLLPHEYFLQAD